MKGRITWLPLAALLAACGPPGLDAVLPATGYPRQLLVADGDSLLASVIWDVGLATETSISTGFLGTRYFQVPVGATAGVHPVALRNGDGTSASLDVTVVASSGVFPAPRIEDVAIWGLNDQGGGLFDAVITVSAANLDTDAAITADGAAPAMKVLWSGLPIEHQLTHTPSTYAYPVYHYAQLAAVVEDVTLGTTLTMTVTNSDGLSASRDITLPAVLANLDRDGDGLLDTWEESGYPAPSGATLDLPTMGCTPLRKDILVEADWIADATPNGTIWATIEADFAAAPVLNPDGTAGVDILIDRGQGGEFTGGGDVLADHTTMDFAPVTAGSPAGYASFFDYKAASFDPDRLAVFHYNVWGRVMPAGNSGRGEIWGNDFQVTFVTFGNWGNDVDEVGTFIHEAGHNFGLRHGGIDNGAVDANQTFKPNMASSMNYRYQFPGVSIDCDFTSEGGHTYGQGILALVDESAVSETTGICDGADLDMNGNGVVDAGVAARDCNLDGDTSDDHVDYDQWGNLLLDFDAPGSRWNGN